MSDNTIVTGLGHNMSVVAEDVDASIFCLPEPQAASTAANKKSRLDLAKHYLNKLDQMAHRKVISAFEKPSMRLHTQEMDSGGALSKARTSSSSFQQNRESGSLGGMMGVSLINVENMSGLSSSMLLMDQNSLSDQKEMVPLHQKLAAAPNNIHSDEDRESPVPTLTQQDLQDLETDFSEGEESELSQGEDEELMAEGMWPASEAGGAMMEGLPSCLLEPQDSLLWEMQSSTGMNRPAISLKEQPEAEGTRKHPQLQVMDNPITCPQEPHVGGSDSKLMLENYDESVFDNSKVNFDAGQISARSTTFGGALDVSKLMSTSCNSLGSLGEAFKENSESSFADQSWGGDPQYDIFEADQGELASALHGESFHVPDLDFLEKEEEENKRANIFMQEESCSGNNLDISCFSGIHGVQEITIRPSWIESPEKMLLGPGNRMLVEDYLKLRSEALGSLGDEDGLEQDRPNFGWGDAVHSPPSAGEPLPLVEVSGQGDDQGQSIMLDEGSSKKNLNSSASSKSMNNEKQENSGYHSTSHSTLQDSSSDYSEGDSERSSSSSGSDTLCGSHAEGDWDVKSLSLNQHQGRIQMANASHTEKNANDSCFDADGSLGTSAQQSVHYSGDLGKSHLDGKEISKLQFERMKNSQQLERTLNEITGPMDSEQIRALLSEAIACDNPQVLVEKIIKISQEKMALHKTMDVSDLDTSVDVLELRKQREALQMKQKERFLQKGQTADKENLGTETHQLRRDSSKKPLKMSHISKADNIDGIPHKHMEKLKAKRTDSVPLETISQTGTHRFPFISKHLSANLGDSHIDESIKIAPYKSRILEDTQKLQFSSFHDNTDSDFDASTPCMPRSKSRSSTLSQNGIGVREANSIKLGVKEQRPKPRMGLSSAHHSKLPLMGKDRVPLNAAHTGHLQRPESIPTHGSEGRALGMVPPSVRSTSVPSGLHGIGVNGEGIDANSAQKIHSAKALRQHHSQEDLNYNIQSGNDLTVSLPKKVVFPGVCVLGIASEVTMVFHNPKQRWVQLSLNCVKESLNRNPATTSGLIFKPSYFVEPQSMCQIQLKICSQQAGSLEAVLEVQVSDLTKGSTIPSASMGVSIHNVLVCAQIEEPHVLLTSGGKEAIDFSIVPEGCSITKEVMVINQSHQSLPVILTLQQVAATSPIFYWTGTADERIKLVSATHVACELPSASTEHGPIPMVLKVTLKAPHLDKIKVDENGVVGLRSQIQVELDSPDQSTIIVAAMPIKAQVGVVKLQSLRTAEPMVLETVSTESCTATVPLRNSSSFPLRISLVPQEHKDVFSVVPAVITIQPHSQVSPSLVFSPRGQLGRMESVLLMRIEPDGMEFEVSMIGISSAAVKKAPEVAKLLTHSSLTRAISAPLPQASQVSLASALESTKSRLVFGTERIGGRASQKIVLRNNCTTEALNLILGIKGSKAFQICEYGGREGKAKMDVVLKPCQEVAFSVFFCPTTVEALSGTLVFRPRGLTEPIKYQIPLQGFGGQCELHVPDFPEGKALVIRELAPALPTMFNTAFVNKGDRAMFVKVQVFSDDRYTQGVAGSQITVQPSEFIINAHESRDIFVVVMGTEAVLSKTPGCIGYLQIVSGDEILRKRFRRLKNKEVKVRRLNDPALVKIDWDVFYSGEKESQSEEDCLPPQPEDAALFFNSCSKTQVELHGERQANEDASSTVFACLDAEETITSVTDLTVAGDRTIEAHSPPVQGKGNVPSGSVGDDRSASRPAAESGTSSAALTWDVFPSTLTILASDTSSHTFFVVNFSNTRQMFEVTSSLKWLHIEPREAILPKLSSVRVNVKLIHSGLPQPLVNPVTQSLQIMCENECHSAKVTVLPDGDGARNTSSGKAELQDPPPSAEYDGRKLPVPDGEEKSTYEKSHTSGEQVSLGSHGKSAMTSSFNRAPGMKRISSSSNTFQNEGTKERHMAKSMVEVVSNSIVFPDTRKLEENFVKVKLRNHDSVVHTVKAEVTQAPFAVRHKQFQVKAGHYVSVPVYFRPQTPGLFSGQLSLCVVEEQVLHIVQLSGKAV
ncbi:uncharacterized protein LOC122252547 [Penaeus japonicus]|uniref:uncharacterized protein LOC122252547 n=1 Tax=Penaeus japonicus TaxID=27405 RepID=UPI001C70D41F|nr:uncharacterized protein LOC122252547 [Penaeus japonicus]